MAARDYGQACSVANFLDRMGARWSLLIVRDLLIGPRRFTELLDGLPGIGTNRLTDRLASLRAEEIVSKTVDPASKGSVYVLTDKGRGLEPIILAMAKWGLTYLNEDSAGKLNRPDLLVVAFRAAFNAEKAKGISEVYEFRIGDCDFFAAVNGRKLSTALGRASNPAFVLNTDAQTFAEIVRKSVAIAEAEKDGRLQFSGDRDAYSRCVRIFSIA